MRIKLKLRRFCKPTFVGVYCCKYLTSISRVSHKLSQASIYWLELSVWVTPQTETFIVLLKILALNKSPALRLSVISRQHGNNNRTITGQGSAVTTILTKLRMFFTFARAILGYDASDVLLNPLTPGTFCKKYVFWTF